MDLNRFLDKRDEMRLTGDFDSYGSVKDPEKGNELIVGARVYRMVYKEMGYSLNEDAPDLLHACVIAMFELVYDMPVIKTVLVDPQAIIREVCGDEEPDRDAVRYANMAVCTLNEVFKGIMAQPERLDEFKDPSRGEKKNSVQ